MFQRKNRHFQENHTHLPKARRSKWFRLLLRIKSSFSLKNFYKIFRGKMILIYIFGGIALFILFAIFSPYFLIKTITLSGEISEEYNKTFKAQFDTLYKKNLLFFNKNKVEKNFREKIPEIKTLEFKEIWPQALNLDIEIQKPYFRLINQETLNSIAISVKGVSLRTPVAEKSPIIKIYEYQKPLIPHEQIISEKILVFINKIQNTLPAKFSLPIKSIEYYYQAREIHVISRNDMSLWFDYNQDFSLQIKKLELASEKIRLNTKKFNHIDLRIPGKLFWEWK